MNETTSDTQCSTLPVLYLAFELGNEAWKLGFTIGLGQNPRRRKIEAGDLAALAWEIKRAKQRFGLPETARVLSCYEAGRDGFWLHRHLVAEGIENRVVDSASIEVNRRAKRAKTDRLDVGKLLIMLIAMPMVRRRCGACCVYLVWKRKTTGICTGNCWL